MRLTLLITAIVALAAPPAAAQTMNSVHTSSQTTLAVAPPPCRVSIDFTASTYALRDCGDRAVVEVRGRDLRGSQP